MIKLNDYFHLDKRATKGSMSLSGKLEAIVGNYFVSGEGNPDETIYTIYYDPTIDSYYNSVELVDKNRIGYVTSDYEYAFIKKSVLDKLERDTEEYKMTIIPVDDLDDQELSIDVECDLPDYFSSVIWIRDDFLYDKDIEFDYEAFEKIDSGIMYLNPDHFSVKELIRAIHYPDK